MKTWHVRVAVAFDQRVTTDTLDDMIDRVNPMAGVLAIDPGEAAVEALVCVDADTVPEAAQEATEAVLAAWRASGMEPTLTGLQVQSEEAFARELATPVYPEVVGFAEIARMGGVSRQRARQWARKESFPRPVIETEQGPLMSKAAVEAWLEKYPRRTGRPPAAVSE